MQSHAIVPVPQAEESTLKKILTNLPGMLTGLVGMASSIPNVWYAMTFMYNRDLPEIDPDQVSLEWFENLPPEAQAGVIYNIIGTLLVSGLFDVVFLQRARVVFLEEFAEFRKGNNTSRFMTESAATLLSALVGGIISGDAYSGLLQWPARVLGFIVVGGLSFLSVNEFILKLTDASYALKKQMLTVLKSFTSDFENEINLKIESREFNPAFPIPFLTNIFDLVHERQAQQKLTGSDISIYRTETPAEYSMTLLGNTVDCVIPSMLAVCTGLVFSNGGYGGLNILTGDNLDDIPIGVKILIGIMAGLPLTLFSGFNSKIYHNSLFEFKSEMHCDAGTAFKLANLFAWSIANATWYHALARTTVTGSDIFSSILNTSFGKNYFPWFVFAACNAITFNGLVPMLFPPTIEMENPRLQDVIKRLQYKITPRELEGLKKLSLFGGKRTSLPRELVLVVKEEKNDKNVDRATARELR